MKEKLPTIFVMIPAYRDPVLLQTIRNVLHNADYPERVFIAIGAQYDDEIPMPDLSEFPSLQIKLLSIHPQNRPATYRLRHVLNKLYAHEDYYLSIDSHTDLKDGWDTDLIRILEGEEQYKTILTFYDVPHSDIPGIYTDRQLAVSPGVLNDEAVSRQGTYPVQHYPHLYAEHDAELKLPRGYLPETHYLPAGLFFTRGQFAREIRWGQYWQNDQEEPFLSYETFMMGWIKKLLFGNDIVMHQPQEYYKAVYEMDLDGGSRGFKDEWQPQKDDLESVRPKIWEAYLHNTGPFKIRGALKKPHEWWDQIGLLPDYFKYTSHDGELF